MDAYLAANPITVLSNTGNVQAVHQATLDMTQAAFYVAGSLTLAPIRPSQAAHRRRVILQNQPNKLKLTASSPQASSGPLSITLSGVNLSGGSTWFDAMGSGTAAFNLPGGNAAGSSVGITLTNDNKPTPTIGITSNDGVTNSTYTVSRRSHFPATRHFRKTHSPRSGSPPRSAATPASRKAGRAC